MALRPVWRGHLRLALVSCPVALYSARHDHGTIRFHLINPATGNRIQMVAQDAGTGEPMSRRDLVKGYEFKKDTYLLLTDEDLEGVKVESSEVMAVEKFVEADSIDPIHYDAGYYLAPDGQAGRDVYAVLREAVARTGRVALSRVVIAQRERTVALRPMAGGLAAHTLHERRDINDAAGLFDGAADIEVDPDMVALATQLIDRQTGQYDPADIEDRYETRLREMIDAKLRGEGIGDEAPAAPPQGNVVDLMAALRRSLGQMEERPAAKAAPGKAKAKATKAAPAKAPPVKASPAKAPRKRAS